MSQWKVSSVQSSPIQEFIVIWSESALKLTFGSFNSVSISGYAVSIKYAEDELFKSQ